MKKRTAAFVLALLMLLPLALSGCGQTAEEPGAELSGELAGVDMEPVQWSFACHAGSTSSYYLMECDFADAVRERTNGLVDITVYASGELPYQGTEFARCVSDGTLEMAAAPFSYISGECPACGVVGWPLLAGEVDELAGAHERLRRGILHVVVQKQHVGRVVRVDGVAHRIFDDAAAARNELDVERFFLVCRKVFLRPGGLFERFDERPHIRLSPSSGEEGDGQVMIRAVAARGEHPRARKHRDGAEKCNQLLFHTILLKNLLSGGAKTPPFPSV